MAILVDENSRVVVQGITGRDGSFHTLQMMEYGTVVVAGVTPGKGGQTFEGPEGASVPIFNSMDEAVSETGANTSAVYVPPASAASAIEEAADADPLAAIGKQVMAALAPPAAPDKAKAPAKVAAVK